MIFVELEVISKQTNKQIKQLTQHQKRQYNRKKKLRRIARVLYSIKWNSEQCNVKQMQWYNGCEP